MLIRYWINILLLIVLAGSSWQVVTDNAPSYGWQHYFYLSAPWLLLYGSIRGWHRCFTWRRMMLAKNISPDLSRGKRVPSKSKKRTSILERACLSLLLLSIAAILKQFGVTNAAWWIALLAGSYVALRFVINKVA